ncbi:MAG: hypothetical protein K6F98_00955 [Bacteroidales bacterium]|nr:hypothetical protein [Bacteroidales bacterium]
MKSRIFVILILGLILSLPLSAQGPEAYRDTLRRSESPFKVDSVFRQTEIGKMTHLSGMKQLSREPEDKRNAYLRQLAREVVLNTGPDWYREYGEWEVTGPFVYETISENPREMAHNGRKYYKVTSRYDKNVERLNRYFASQVDIWEDDGQPMGVDFGLGMGLSFTLLSYNAYLDLDIAKRPVQRYDSRPDMILYAE